MSAPTSYHAPAMTDREYARFFGVAPITEQDRAEIGREPAADPVQPETASQLELIP